MKKKEEGREGNKKKEKSNLRKNGLEAKGIPQEAKTPKGDQEEDKEEKPKESQEDSQKETKERHPQEDNTSPHNIKATRMETATPGAARSGVVCLQTPDRRGGQNEKNRKETKKEEKPKEGSSSWGVNQKGQKN